MITTRRNYGASETIACSHCAKPTARPCKGRCPTCYAYFRRTKGNDRPLEARPLIHLCANSACGIATTMPRKKRCSPCYRYLRRHGIDRVNRAECDIVKAPDVRRDAEGRILHTCIVCNADWHRSGAHGRCNACYRYHRIHGFDRTAEACVAKRRAIPPGVPCAHCGGDRRAVALRSNPRCHRCAAYFYDHKRERPLEPVTPRGIFPCENCQAPTARAWGIRQFGVSECATCGQYRRLHDGAPRPPGLWGRVIRPDGAVTPCGNPACLRPVRKGLVRGRCRACANYFRTHNTERPMGLRSGRPPAGKG